MRSIIAIAGMLLLAFSIKAQPSHQSWDELLKKHVSEAGNVNYEGFKNDRARLNSYLESLEKNPPADSWSKAEKMAYWINAYNAYTIALILDHYPVKSINDISKDGKKPWDIPFIKIGGKTYTLNNIEHDILRKKYSDPRIHFAVNCASYSCPPLMNKAFTAASLEVNLDKLAKAFINDPGRNKITANSIQVSQIFNWFSEDFTKNGTLIDYLNRYSNTRISPGAKVSYLEYNWSLNK